MKNPYRILLHYWYLAGIGDAMNYKKYQTLMEDVIKIRTAIFVEEQGFKNEFDDIDKTCTHIVLYDKQTPVGTCRYFHEGPNYHIGRVAVSKKYRCQHLGEHIMQIAEDEIKNEGGKQIEVSAQVRVKDFYHKLGYQGVGAVYYDEYCEHIRMVKLL